MREINMLTHKLNIAGYKVFFDNRKEHWLILTGQYPTSMYRSKKLNSLLKSIYSDITRGYLKEKVEN